MDQRNVNCPDKLGLVGLCPDQNLPHDICPGIDLLIPLMTPLSTDGILYCSRAVKIIKRFFS